MAHSQDISVRGRAAIALGPSFPHLTDKEQAWNDLLVLVKDEDGSVQGGAAHALVSAVPCLTDEEQAWNDLLVLVKDEDIRDRSVRVSVAIALGSAFPCLTNKEQATKDLLALAKDESISVRGTVAIALGPAFPCLTDKEQATKDLLALAKDEDKNVRWSAATALASLFPYLTDKEQAWKDLLALVKDEDGSVQGGAAIALGLAFPHLKDQEQAWKDLLALVKDKDAIVRWCAANALGSAFPHLKDQEQVWKDLLALAKDEDAIVRGGAAMAIGSAFPHLTDEEQAWKDLLALVKDEDAIVRWSAADAIGSAYPHLKDKEQAWKDLLALAKDEDIIVRWGAATALSSAAKHYINKKNFKKASQFFSEASSVFKYDLLGHIKPDPEFYLYKGFGCYCQGRALVSELPEKDPEKYVKNIKKAVSFLKMSIKYINKSGFREYENETRFFPICLNIYSALYEYNLSYLNFDKKRFAKIKDYLDNASAHCKIAGTQQGKGLVKILEKLTSSLKIRLEGIEQEKKKYEAAEKGKGGGWDAKYESHIDKLEKDFKDSLVEIDNALNELEAPLFKKIAAIEKESLEKLQSREPKTSLQRLHEIINGFIKKFWKIIAAIGLILVTVVGIIKNWQFISELIKNLLK